MGILESINQKKSKAEEIQVIFKKYEKLFKSYHETANFKEPCLILMRNNRKAEFHENATHGKFRFDHTDGTMREIILNPAFLMDFPYGKRTFKCYVAHEDFPTPLPEDPVVTAEMFQMAIDKIQADSEKWKAKKKMELGVNVKQILIGIGILFAIIAGVVIVASLLGTDLSGLPFMGGGNDVAQQVAQRPLDNV